MLFEKSPYNSGHNKRLDTNEETVLGHQAYDYKNGAKIVERRSSLSKTRGVFNAGEIEVYSKIE